MPQKISARQTGAEKCLRKFLKGKPEPENASENFCEANRRRKMVQKISARQTGVGLCFRKFLWYKMAINDFK
jgi:hypothetical protein